MAPEETRITSWPFFRNAATSSARASSQRRLKPPVDSSTRRAEPILTTRRLAEARALTLIPRSVHKLRRRGLGRCIGRRLRGAVCFDDGEGDLEQFRHAGAGDAGDLEQRSAGAGGLHGAGKLAGFARDRLGIEGVDLVEADELRLLRQLRTIGREFGADAAIGLAHMLGRAVHEMDQNAAALDMAEEPVAQARALMGALDEAGMSASTNSRAPWRTTPS